MDKNDDSTGSDSLEKSLRKKCVVDDVGTGDGFVQNIGVKAFPNSGDEISQNRSDTTENPLKRQKTGEVIGVCDKYSNSSAVDIKVKQISQDLKEASLKETVNQTTSAEDMSSSSSSLESEQATFASQGNSTQIDLIDNADMSTSELSINESMDELDANRYKKVRFHPDVKENDGGNRIIPKKKKKLKSIYSIDGSSTSVSYGTDDDVDFDDDDDIEDEADFDLAKTIAEAQNYLKSHPLTFVHRASKIIMPVYNTEPQEDIEAPQQYESPDEEDCFELMSPENGIGRILGKQSRCGKIEYLLRFADQPGLFWESEDFVWKQCPNMLMIFDYDRERRQERLMRHVAKRQNKRQRYTDF